MRDPSFRKFRNAQKVWRRLCPGLAGVDYETTLGKLSRGKAERQAKAAEVAASLDAVQASRPLKPPGRP